jgi:hypothetical protein
MKLSNISTTVGIFFVMLALMSCAGNESGSPQATVAESGSPAVASDDQRPARDTVDWQFVATDTQPPDWSAPVDREWPGEEIGVIGPIIALGGSGSKTYVAIYDPGGIFIGALYLKEARKDPSRLENLIRLARVRGSIQNSRTIDHVSVLRFLSLAQAARQKETP